MSSIKRRFKEIHAEGSFDSEACLVAESLSDEFFLALAEAEADDNNKEDRLISLAEILIKDVQECIKKGG